MINFTNVNSVNTQRVKFRIKAPKTSKIVHDKETDGLKTETTEHEWEEGDLYAIVDGVHSTNTYQELPQTSYLIKSDKTNQIQTYSCQDYLLEIVERNRALDFV